MKIVCINGYPASGKDTFANFCCEYNKNEYSINVSTVDFVKEVAKDCGWDGSKSPKNRKFLSDLKDLLTSWGDVPYKKIVDEINNLENCLEFKNSTSKGLVFIHVREPVEIQKFVDRIGAKTIFIDRSKHDEISNHADEEVENFKYDYYIDNNGNLDELKEKAIDFVDMLMGEK